MYVAPQNILSAKFVLTLGNKFVLYSIAKPGSDAKPNESHPPFSILIYVPSKYHCNKDVAKCLQ